MNEDGICEYSVIYKITFPNNKIYIGRHKYNLKRLISRYKSEVKNNNDRPVVKDIIKYKFENIYFEFIEEINNCLSSFIDEREKFWIKELKSLVTENGYNISSGGFPTRNGAILSKLTRNKIAKKAKERLKNKENHPLYGKTPSEETRTKISESNKRNNLKGEKNANWIKPPKKEILEKYIKENKSFREIMKILNVSQMTLHKFLNIHFGTKSLSKSRKKLNMFNLDKDELMKMVQKNKTIREICFKLGTNNKYVSKVLDYYYGIKSLPKLKLKLGIIDENDKFLRRELRK